MGGAFVGGAEPLVKNRNHYAETGKRVSITGMNMPKYVVVQDQGKWRGYLEGYSDHLVQGESFDELQFKLSHLTRELLTGKLPTLRKVA